MRRARVMTPRRRADSRLKWKVYLRARALARANEAFRGKNATVTVRSRSRDERGNSSAALGKYCARKMRWRYAWCLIFLRGPDGNWEACAALHCCENLDGFRAPSEALRFGVLKNIYIERDDSVDSGEWWFWSFFYVDDASGSWKRTRDIISWRQR